ncbi:hypothetical protein [Bradyrhizobium archetypum]|uniref:Uncharacterized protein n=1 Tax=Bradyrhizobium archetypum TaxID=2721160 RepID=A0A7Y4H3K3_9BRAD|nr:hypothetical protein [Bradyrhizobium archetypum]NOJ47019.1 hypothetical protein [Bradyrhizobium archetypum]
MTRFARSISSFSRIGPFGTVAHSVLMHSRMRDSESTTAQIGSTDGTDDGEPHRIIEAIGRRYA